MQKTRSDSLAEKLSPEQKATLIDWLSDHSYSETCELVAAPPPDGFGFETSRAALCRFYKAHFAQIETRRQEKLCNRALDQLEYEDREPHYREVLADSAHLFLQERFYESLTQPVESIDELKKLVSVAAKMKECGFLTDPNAELKNDAHKTKLLRDLTAAIAKKPFSKSRAAAGD